MDKRLPSILLLTLAGLFTAFPLFAETFSWTDENGAVNFTEEYSNIPQKYRNKVLKREEIEYDRPQAQGDSSRSVDGNGVDVRSDKQSNALTKQLIADPEGIFGGKRGEEWAGEFRAINSEISLLEQKIRQSEELNKRPAGLNSEQINSLPQEIVSLIMERNGAIKRYNELNDRANRDGVPAEYRN